MIYFVSTPIGNLKDISFRAIETLKQVDIVACEDTRVTVKLLNEYNIKKPLITYNKNNEKSSAEGIIKLSKEGKEIAIVSDCGMPLISDPGQILTMELKKNQIPYTIIPGANASLSALVLSGISSDKFSFIGFLPEKLKDKLNLIKEISKYKTTLLFHISPHNIEEDINFLFENLGNRKACLVKEITKLFETVLDFNLGDELSFDKRGEFILVVEGNNKEIDESENIKNCAEILLKNGIPSAISSKIISDLYKISKNEAYKLLIRKNK